MIRPILLIACALAALPATGCRRETDRPAPAAGAEPPAAGGNRIDIPAIVRSNLGITFAAVEPRHVERTIRVPGRFELAPHARREYRTVLGGRVELRVAQFDRVEPGQVLFTLDSPQWRELQERLSETESQLQQARARAETIEPLMAAHERHHDELQIGVEIWTQRVEQLQQTRDSGVVTAEEFAQARASLATTRAELAEVLEKEAELQSRRIEIDAILHASRQRLELLASNASSLLGVPPQDLVAVDPASPDQQPRWREIDVVEVRAAAPGVVESLAVTSGAWAAETDLVVTTIQPQHLRFRGRGLQSDLHRLRDGLPGRVVPPKGSESTGGSAAPAPLEGPVTLGLTGDPDERTIELFMTPGPILTAQSQPAVSNEPPAIPVWARAGVAAHLEIVTAGDGHAELAIPLSATIRDGLQTILFRRNPENADQVIRLEADLGINDGRWVVVNSGLRAGDEVVLDGIYPLMLATSGTVQKGGHFHADGTWHGEDH